MGSQAIGTLAYLTVASRASSPPQRAMASSRRPSRRSGELTRDLLKDEQQGFT